MVAPPVATLLGIVGLFKDESKKFAIATLIVGGISLVLWLVMVLG